MRERLTRRGLLQAGAAGALVGASGLRASPASAWAVEGQRINTTFPDAIAIHSYDPVAYFTYGRPMIGSDSWTVQWSGVTWRFVDEIGKVNFEREPTRWAPTFGGFCAMGVAEGHLRDVDPRIWKQERNDVFLFENQERQLQWLANLRALIRQGREAWPALQR